MGFIPELQDDSTYTNVIHNINKIQNPHSHPIRYGVYDVTYMYLKVIKMDLFTKLKETKQTYGYQWGKDRGDRN